MTGMIASSYLNTKTPFFHAILLAFFPFRFLLYSTKRCAGSLQLCIELYCIICVFSCIALNCIVFNYIVINSIILYPIVFYLNRCLALMVHMMAMKSEVVAIAGDSQRGLTTACQRVRTLSEEIIDKWAHSIPHISVDSVLSTKPPGKVKWSCLPRLSASVSLSLPPFRRVFHTSQASGQCCALSVG